MNKVQNFKVQSLTEGTVVTHFERNVTFVRWVSNVKNRNGWNVRTALVKVDGEFIMEEFLWDGTVPGADFKPEPTIPRVVMPRPKRDNGFQPDYSEEWMIQNRMDYIPWERRNR